MLRKIKSVLARLRFRPLPVITQESTLGELMKHYPNTVPFIRKHYGARLIEADKSLSLKKLAKKYTLPPPQLFFMEIQMQLRAKAIRTISAKEAKALLEKEGVRLLDVRESWELNVCSIPSAQPLNQELMDSILAEWDRATPIVLYCHFGVRSFDAASFLSENGFKSVHVIQGGIDAWALDVDPNLRRYESAWC